MKICGQLLLWVELCPPKNAEALTLSTCRCDLGNRVFADDQVNMTSLECTLIQCNYVYIKKEKQYLDTETDMHTGRTPCDHEERLG